MGILPAMSTHVANAPERFCIPWAGMAQFVRG